MVETEPLTDEEDALLAGDLPPPVPITLVQFPPVWGRNVSPFALKLEAWLRLAEVPFRIETSSRLGKAPKGKLPYIHDQGRTIGDSTLVIEHLKATRGLDPDAGLRPRELAEAVALQRLFEDHFYFAITYSRWLDPEGWAVIARDFFAGFPLPMRLAGPSIVRRSVRTALHHQGLGRHSREEVYALARADLVAVSDYLADRPFFMGDRLTSIDAVAYAFLANILLVPVETELKRLARTFTNLVGWTESMEAGLQTEG